MSSTFPPLEIRPYQGDVLDRSGLAAVISPGFPCDRWVTDPLFANESLGPLFVAGALEMADRSLATPDLCFGLLALREDLVQGVALGYLETTLEEFTSLRVGTLWSLAVFPEARRQGVATALFGAVQTWMIDHDCLQLNVATDGPNPANELYRKAGCVERHLLRTWSLDLGGRADP